VTCTDPWWHRRADRALLARRCLALISASGVLRPNRTIDCGSGLVLFADQLRVGL
jgi:hypothetical protein